MRFTIPTSHYVLKKSGFIPIYKLPVTRYTNNTIKLSWGLHWFYLSDLFAKNPKTSRFRWFMHLYWNIITFIALPYTLIHNRKYNGDFNLDFKDRYPDD